MLRDLGIQLPTAVALGIRLAAALGTLALAWRVRRMDSPRSFAVAVLDWRGQGLSDRALADARKGHVDDFSQYDSDLASFMQQVVLPDCPPPVFAIGHSMGASVLIRAAFQGWVRDP